MKTIIAGSRTINNYTLLCNVIQKAQDKNIFITEVVSGGANGVDKMGERWARENQLPLKIFPAHWDVFGKSAGYRRNEEMAKYADSVIILWDGVSKGTHHMIALADKYNLKTHLYTTNPHHYTGGCISG